MLSYNPSNIVKKTLRIRILPSGEMHLEFERLKMHEGSPKISTAALISILIGLIGLLK